MRTILWILSVVLMICGGLFISYVNEVYLISMSQTGSRFLDIFLVILCDVVLAFLIAILISAKITIRRKVLLPYCHGQPGCPELKAGDALVSILENESKDLIAGLCGMDDRIEAGTKVKWKVSEVMPHGSIVIKSGSHVTILNHLKWNGNRVRVPGTLAYTEKLIRFFKVERR